LLLLFVLVLAGLALILVRPGALALPPAPEQINPTWLEPRGLSVVEMVGQIDDKELDGAILSYGDGDGIVVYDAGRRLGSTVVVTATLYPRLDLAPVYYEELTQFGCLSQAPHYDHLGSIVPTSTLRVYDTGGREVTSEIVYMTVTRMDRRLPLADSTEPFRYPQQSYGPNRPLPLPLGPAGLEIPASSGCSIIIPGANYYPLTGVFRLELEGVPQVELVGRQEEIFQSYIGQGWLGIFQPLMDQLRAAYDDRHGRILLAIPPGADFFLLKFPPMPGDPYTDCCSLPYLNAERLSAGTYRLSNQTPSLSTDLVFSAGFALGRTWQDTDQVPPQSEFLPTFEPITEMAPPEYVIPAGTPFDPCFTQGGCPDGVLQQIHDAGMALEILYFRVDRPGQGGEWLPLHLAGPAWMPPVGEEVPVPTLVASEVLTGHVTYLPLIVAPPPANPLGWFDELGRMLDFAPAPSSSGGQ
jgi:hypothetical protein